MTAKRGRFEQVLFERSGDIYTGMKARARKVGFKDLPFTLEDFRLWLEGKFGKDGEARCEYSGEMILAENFSVDHRKPISRGGTFELENLALCAMKHNLRKGIMTKAEYSIFCSLVCTHLPYEVQDSIWKRLEIGDVQRYSHFRRQRKLAHQ
jgi:hypothetical protein